MVKSAPASGCSSSRARARWRGLAVTAGLGLALAACGGEPTPPIAGGSGSTGSTPRPSDAPFASAAPVPTDHTVVIAPTMFDASVPCPRLAVTVPVEDVPDSCINAWVNYDAAHVPGEDQIARSHISMRVRVAQGVDDDTARAAANAFYRSAVLREWSLREPAIAVTRAIQTPASNDQLLLALHNGDSVVSVPDCDYPTDLRVAMLSTGEASFFVERGFPDPFHHLVIVADYPSCPGITMNVMTSKGVVTKVEFGNPQPNADVVTGQVENLPALGSVWVSDGALGCANGALAQVCGR